MRRPIRDRQAALFREATADGPRPVPELLNHVAAREVLAEAWRLTRRASVGPGLGPEAARALLLDLSHQLQAGTYRPGTVRRFEVPKPGCPGRMRSVVMLGDADRVVHTAVKLVLEPLVEARLGTQTFGFRPGRGRFDQLVAIRRRAEARPGEYAAAVAADVADCFDRLDHRLLLEDARALTRDADWLTLLRLLLEQVGSGRRGWWRRHPVGVLQGSPLSPLLANLHLDRLDLAWRRRHGGRAPLFRYADDLIVLARDLEHARQLRRDLERMLGRLCHLELASQKTALHTLEAGIPVLGMVVRRHLDPYDRADHVRIFLDPAVVRRALVEIERQAAALSTDRPLGRQFARLNQRLRGWFEAFQFAHDAGPALETLDLVVHRAVRDRLGTMLDLNAGDLRAQHGLRLASGHVTWQADGEALLVLGALSRRVHRPRRHRLPWERPAPVPIAAASPSLLPLPQLAGTGLAPDQPEPGAGELRPVLTEG